MADQKITDLPVTTTLSTTDLLTVVTDPAGTPTNKKIAQGDLAATILALANGTDFSCSGSGKGIVVTTPNGAHTYRIAVDNDGTVTTEQLT